MGSTPIGEGFFFVVVVVVVVVVSSSSSSFPLPLLFFFFSSLPWFCLFPPRTPPYGGSVPPLRQHLQQKFDVLVMCDFTPRHPNYFDPKRQGRSGSALSALACSV
jgi:hypothetical protein